MKTKVLYRFILLCAGVTVAFLALALETRAQSHEGFLYGKIYTGNNVYTGPIRWGNEEVLWTDLFNAAKTENSFEKLVPEQSGEDRSWFDFDWSFESIWENKAIHQFTCQFGNISEISKTGRQITLKFKNGGEMAIKGEGYNDVGSTLYILDEELGTIGIGWDRVERVKFMPTPSRLPLVFGTPLYGTVEGERREQFTGFIVWDNDERLSTDKLDGDDKDGDVSIKFSEVKSIEREGKGSRVTLKSGRELYLTGSNDVNNENRGVLIATPDMGVVNLAWSAFRKVTFSTPVNTGTPYGEFAAPKVISGEVSLIDDKNVSGRIIFDIDEALDFEIVEGKENDIEYMIPIKKIRRIIPKNDSYSQIELMSGKTLLLGDARDVSSDNDGLLIFPNGGKKPVYASWRKIIEIRFN